MSTAMAAGYCGETTVDALLNRVGKDYPLPRLAEGRRRLWLIDDLDAATAPNMGQRDLAEDFVIVQLPRHVIPKQHARGETAYYCNMPTKYRQLKCPVNEPVAPASP